MNPIAAVTSVLRNYVNFSGRAQRSEFWWFFLFSLVSEFALFYLVWIGSPLRTSRWYWFIYLLFLTLPTLAVSVRRLHDINRSGAWVTLPFISGIGAIIWPPALFVLMWSTPLNNWGGPRSPDMAEMESQAQISMSVFNSLLVIGIVWVVAALVIWAVMLAILALPGTHGANRYGLDPLLAEPQPD